MKKPLSLFWIIFIFIGSLLGSIALYNEMNARVQPSEVSGTAGNEVQASVVVDAPEAQAVISSPVTITGKARGNWFFEAVFPVQIIDGNGKVLGSGQAHATGDWMTTEYVPFSAQVSFSGAETRNGFLLFKKDNPSGLPENDATIAVPVSFSK